MAGNLAGAELLKEVTERRDDRVEIFLKKYKNKEKFEMVSGQELQFKINKDIVRILETVQGKFNDRASIKMLDTMVFTPSTPTAAAKVAKTNTAYYLKDFKKTPEFGGGGAGEDTERNESATALYCAARWKNKTAMKAVYTEKNLRAALSDVDVSLSETEKMMPHMLPDRWQNSCAFSADALYREYPVAQNKQYMFHRQSRWVKQLENKFKALNADLGDDKFSQINKWSPADIWMVKKGFTMDFTKIKTMLEFNSELLRLAETGEVIGVSLKLTNQNAHVSKVNFTQKEKSKFKFIDYSVDGGRGLAVNFFGNNNVDVEFSKDGDILYRTFGTSDTAPGYSGEISGALARHGKVGLGEISKIYRRLTGDTAPEYTKIRTELRGGKDAREKFFTNFLKYAQKLTRDNKLKTMKLEEFMKEAGGKNLLWIMSKYIGVYILYHLIKKNETSAKKDIMDRFTEDCYLVASSQTPLSAPFLKIS